MKSYFFILLKNITIMGVSIFCLIMSSFFLFLLNNKQETIINKTFIRNLNSFNSIDDNPINIFIGTMTGYGPDCNGCTGRTACYPYYDVRDGNILYEDVEYGKVRVVAADSRIPCGTIVKITAPKLYDYPFIAIVLDRGGLIKGNKFDLLYQSQKEALYVGFQRNVEYKILRNSWN